MSNRIFQSIVNKMKDAVDRTIGVFDENGVVVACSNLSEIGIAKKDIRDEVGFSGNILKKDGFTYCPLIQENKSGYVSFVSGEDAEAEHISKVVAISLGNIKNIYDEKYDKGSFVKNVIFDNILPTDIYIKSKELHFVTDVRRVVLLLRFEKKKDIVPYEIVQSMFPYKNKDYVISVSDTDVVFVRELKGNADQAAVENMANEIVDTISSESYIKVVVGIGTIVDSIKDLSRSYKEAQVALEVGKVFDTEKSVVCYENLGIGRLIYQLPTTLCEMFLQEVFKKESLESLDRETLLTIQCFFENNLNISETSRKLFVHRNTLVYRLERIKKITGLDLREFDNAITFKVALMVKKYLTSKPVKF